MFATAPTGGYLASGRTLALALQAWVNRLDNAGGVVRAIGTHGVNAGSFIRVPSHIGTEPVVVNGPTRIFAGDISIQSYREGGADVLLG